MKMDHHCPWINTCCGHYNHLNFVFFLFFSPCGCVHALVIMIRSIYRAMNFVWFSSLWTLCTPHVFLLVLHWFLFMLWTSYIDLKMFTAGWLTLYLTLVNILLWYNVCYHFCVGMYGLEPHLLVGRWWIFIHRVHHIIIMSVARQPVLTQHVCLCVCASHLTCPSVCQRSYYQLTVSSNPMFDDFIFQFWFW